MGAYYGTEAFVLGSREYGEADRIVTLYTRELGRVDAIAKGVRLAKSKLRGHLNQFSRLRVLLTPGKEYWRLLDADSEARVSGASRLGYVSDYAAFLMRLITEPEQDDALWDVIVSVFPEIDTREALFSLKIRTLAALGFLPDKEELRMFFSPRAVQYIVGEANASFLANDRVAQEFAFGIQKILAQSHGR